MIESLELLREFPDQLQVLCGENGVPVELNADSQDHTAAEEVGGFLEGQGLGMVLRNKIHHIIVQLCFRKLNCKKDSYSQDEYDVKPQVAVKVLHYAAPISIFLSKRIEEYSKHMLDQLIRFVTVVFCQGFLHSGYPLHETGGDVDEHHCSLLYI